MAQDGDQHVELRAESASGDRAGSAVRRAGDRGAVTGSDVPSKPHLGVRLGKAVIQVALAAGVIAAAVAGYQYLKQSKPEIAKRAGKEKVFNVTAFTAALGSYQPELTLYGSTVAGREVDIRALVAGQIVMTSSKLREGGEIEKGETLLSIDAFDYRTALVEGKAQLRETRAKVKEFEASLASEKTALENATAQAKLAKADLDRATKLVRQGTLSQRAVEERQQTLLQREQTVSQMSNNLDVWQARISQQRAAADRLVTAVNRAAQRLEETNLKAPFNAYVTEVGAQVGRIVSANDKVATLIDRDWVEARFTLADDQYGRIVAAEGDLKGREVKVAWVLGGTRFSYTARVDRVGARISSDAGGVDVYARILDPLKPVPLRPGAFVEVTVPDKRFVNVIKVPPAGLYDGDTVYVIEDERMAPRKVKVVGSVGADLLVEGDLNAGDRVIETRISTPGAGIRVKELNSAPERS